MTVFAGVDAGATKTVAAIGDGTREIARAVGPAGAVRPGRAMAAASAIATTIRRALASAGLLRADALVVGASGVGRDEERQALRDALRTEALTERLVVTTDIEIVLEAAFGRSPGIVVLAGTGSFAVARLEDGRLVRQGGYGWQMGDEGGGYAIGRAGLAAAGQAHDGRAPVTSLESALIGAARVPDFDGLVRWSVAAAPSEVAALAATVVAEAERGDPAAVAILWGGAAALAGHAAVLVGQVAGAGAVPVALAGGLAEQAGYRREIETALGSLPRVTVQAGVPDPAHGALALAGQLRV